MGSVARSQATTSAAPLAVTLMCITRPTELALRRMSPRSSRTITSWFIACGVTKTRRASCADDSPSRSRKMESAVYSGVVMPHAESAWSSRKRSPRSTRLTRYAIRGSRRGVDVIGEKVPRAASISKYLILLRLDFGSREPHAGDD